MCAPGAVLAMIGTALTHFEYALAIASATSSA
jgi:hypothetical protein